jgi:hypothetical protein
MRLRLTLGIRLAASALGLASLCASAQPAATGNGPELANLR